MLKSPENVEVSVHLGSRGRYTWTITHKFDSKDGETGVNEIRKIDGLLKENFPNYTQMTTGRVRNADLFREP